MGRRKNRGGLTGLSRFLPENFKQEPEEHPSKRQRVDTTDKGDEDLAGNWIEKYNASSLIPHYTDESQLPEHLKKYFLQRFRYFSLYSTPPGCLLDEEGWYSVTPELVANQVAERCRCDTILDSFCGVGGNAIAFAKTCHRVIALDISPTRLALARHNAQIYGVADRIEFILADYISFAKTYHTLPHTQPKRCIDVIFLSPPWGGPSYLSGNPREPSSNEPNLEEPPAQAHPEFSLSAIKPIHGKDLFKLSRKITPNIAYYLPRNTRLKEISDLLENNSSEPITESSEVEYVEVEEEWMGSKLKALTCYFGGLVEGQEVLF